MRIDPLHGPLKFHTFENARWRTAAVLRVVDSDMMYRTLSRGRRRRSGDVPGLMDLPSDSDGFTLRRDAEVQRCSSVWFDAIDYEWCSSALTVPESAPGSQFSQ